MYVHVCMHGAMDLSQQLPLKTISNLNNNSTEYVCMLLWIYRDITFI